MLGQLELESGRRADASGQAPGGRSFFRSKKSHLAGGPESRVLTVVLSTFTFRCWLHPQSNPLVKGRPGIYISSRLPRRVYSGVTPITVRMLH